MATYKIVRRYAGNHPPKTIAEGLSLEEVKKHCNDSESSSSEATSDDAIAHTAQFGPWFDSWTKE